MSAIVVIVLIGAGAVLGALAWWDFARKRRAGGAAVLGKLARPMRLSRTDRRAISRIAHVAGVPPASLLISRGCFDAAWTRAERDVTNSERIDQLRSRLFS